MLLGKLGTPALKSYTISPFETKIVEAWYIAVKAERYVIGEPKVGFELRFGNLKIKDEKKEFEIVTRAKLELTNEELISWGTDDSVVLDLIAAKLGNTITEKVIVDSHFTY